MSLNILRVPVPERTQLRVVSSALVDVHEDLARRPFVAAVIAAIALGALVRAIPVVAAGFPLNDGGLFFAMTRDLQASHYALPSVTSYNSAHIPYAYPPLSFYAAGLLDDATPLSLLGALRLLPLTSSILAMPAFFLLARRFIASRVALVCAMFAFALTPHTFDWMIMGGGLTRSTGYLFALLALHQVHVLYTTRKMRYALGAGILGGCTLLSHIEIGWFFVCTSALFFAAYGRSRNGMAGTAVAASIALALTAPWWGMVTAHHGVSPFVAAVRSASASQTSPLVRLIAFDVTAEPLFMLITASGVLGAIL